MIFHSLQITTQKAFFKFCVLAHRPTMMYSAAYSTGGLLQGAES